MKVKSGMWTEERYIMSNFIKITEISESQQRWPSNVKKYNLDEVFLNIAFVSSIRDGSYFKKEIKSYKGWPKGLDQNVELAEIALHSGSGPKILYAIDNFKNIIRKIGANNG